MSVEKKPIYRKIYENSRYLFPMCLCRSNMSYCYLDYNLYGKVYNSEHYKMRQKGNRGNLYNEVKE